MGDQYGRAGRPDSGGVSRLPKHDRSHDFDPCDDEADEDRCCQPATCDGRSQERDYEQKGRADPVARRAALEVGRGCAARVRRSPAFTDEPDAEKHDDSEHDPYPRTVGERLREDAPRVAAAA